MMVDATGMLTLGALSLCGFVIVAGVCRVDLLELRKHKILYTMSFVLFPTYAVALAIRLLETGRLDVAWLGLVAIAAHLAATMDIWKDGPPRNAWK